MVTVFTASNTHYRPFIQGWKAFDNGLNLSARYRYNTVNDAHSDKELDGNGCPPPVTPVRHLVRV